MRILITSKQYPYYGGSATNAYKLILLLRKKKFNVAGLYFMNPANVDIDPDNTGVVIRSTHNSRTQRIEPPTNEAGIRSRITEILGGYPDIILAFNYYLPVISKNTFPHARVVYMVVGSPVLTMGEDSPLMNGISAERFMGKSLEPMPLLCRVTAASASPSRRAGTGQNIWSTRFWAR